MQNDIVDMQEKKLFLCFEFAFRFMDFWDGWNFVSVIFFILTTEQASLLVDGLSSRILVVRFFLFHEQSDI